MISCQATEQEHGANAPFRAEFDVDILNHPELD
jgi:hypothetical protein